MVLNTAFQYQSIEVTYRILASIFSLDFSGPSKGMSMLCSVFLSLIFWESLFFGTEGNCTICHSLSFSGRHDWARSAKRQSYCSIRTCLQISHCCTTCCSFSLLKRGTGVKRELSSLRNSEPMVEEHVDRFCDPPKRKVGHMWSKLVSLHQFWKHLKLLNSFQKRCVVIYLCEPANSLQRLWLHVFSWLKEKTCYGALSYSLTFQIVHHLSCPC